MEVLSSFFSQFIGKKSRASRSLRTFRAAAAKNLFPPLYHRGRPDGTDLNPRHQAKQRSVKPAIRLGQFHNGDARFPLAVASQAEPGDLPVAAQRLMHRGAQRPRSLAVDDGNGLQPRQHGPIQKLV